MITIPLEPELVIVSLNTELYMYKCLIVTLQIENSRLTEQLKRFRVLADDVAAASGLAIGASA